MALQLIPQVLPCGKPVDLRALGFGFLAGQTYNAGDIPDGTDLVAGARYVVSGIPSSGTITYNSVQQSVGSTFLGVSGQTAFTRSTSTVRLVRTETAVTPPASLKASYYIVSGAGSARATYQNLNYSPGQAFRAVANTPATLSGGAVLYEIEASNKVEVLATHKIGARPIPGLLDFSSALGVETINGAAVPAENLNRVYLWNFGTAKATVIIKAYNTEFDAETGATRRDWQFDLPANQQPFIWFPSEGFRQGAEGIVFGEDRVYAQDAFIFQTSGSNKDVWIKPEATDWYGLNNTDLDG